MLPDSRGLCGVCLGHWRSVGKRRFLTLCKLRVFHFQTHLGKQVGCLLSLGNWLHYSRYKCKEVTLLKETMSSDLHTKTSRHRTPTFLMRLHLRHLPHRNHFNPGHYGKLQLMPSVYFQGWDTAGRYDGREPAIWVPGQKHCSHPVKSPWGGKGSNTTREFHLLLGESCNL